MPLPTINTSTSYLKRKPKLVRRQEENTPPMMMERGRNASTSSVDICDYFCAQPYKPLSFLPTPPLSSHCPREPSLEGAFSLESSSDLRFLGPATHLTNLIPSSTSLIMPSVPLVQSLLSHAGLPIETLALAVAILDSLNSRFALQWRRQLPLSAHSEEHIDEVLPEIIVLAAVVLAVKFLDDFDGTMSTKYFANEWGLGRWDCDKLNFTQHCLLENLGYHLLPLWEESIIQEAIDDMGRAGERSFWIDDEVYYAKEVRMGTGKAVLGVENQLTPIETPSPGAVAAKVFLFEKGLGKKIELPHPPKLQRSTQTKEFSLFTESTMVGMGYCF